MNDQYDDEKPIAIALQYDGENAPTVKAKGQGLVADSILDLAKEHDIPIERDPILATALSAVELDEEIPVELYQVVAQIIGFIMRSNETATSHANLHRPG